MGFVRSSDSISTFAKFHAKKGVFIIKTKNPDGKWVQSGEPENYVSGTVEGLYPRSYEYKGETKSSFQLIINGSEDPINKDMISIEFNETRVFGAILPCFTKINKGDKITMSARMKNDYCNIYVNDENGELIKTGYDWHKVMMPMLNTIDSGSLQSFYKKQLEEKFGKRSSSNNVASNKPADTPQEDVIKPVQTPDLDDDLPF